jgi:anti-sigma regulatory factor (Ser/Thr protein kinase)
MGPRAHTAFPPNPNSVREARQFVQAALDAWDCDDPDEVAVLLTSEVVTNAIRHAATDFSLDVTLDGDDLCVEVTDRSTHPPVPRQPKPDGSGGRGLGIVAALSKAWGTSIQAEGKVVWFVVALDHARGGSRVHP